MVTNIRPVNGQHTVTERVLKEFIDPAGNLAVFDRAYRQRRRFSPGAGIFKTTFDSYDSRGTEERWNLFETRFPEALEQVHDRTAASDPQAIEILKDMVALHWTRSRGMTKVRDDIVDRFLQRHRRTNADRDPVRLAAAFRQRTGLIASSQSEIEWMNDKIAEEFERDEVAKLHSESNARNFAAARSRFEALDLAIRYSRDDDLAIGDVPVITTVEGSSGAGPHQGIGILTADHISMPITPHALAVLGVDVETSELSKDDVDRCNTFQWSTYDVWIAALPGGTADDRLQLEARSK